MGNNNGIVRQSLVNVLTWCLGISIFIGGGILVWKSGLINFHKDKTVQETLTETEIISGHVEVMGEFNTAKYVFTAVEPLENYKNLPIVNLPIGITKKLIAIQYDGWVEAGIKDMSKTKVKKFGTTVFITLPEVELTGVELDNSSCEVIYESNNPFNSTDSLDTNTIQSTLIEEMKTKAIDSGIFTTAKERAEYLLTEMYICLDNVDNVEFLWK